MLAGQTRAEAAKAIDTALATYYTNLSAQVTVTKYTANKVLVLGAVEKPGVVTFDGTPTLLEALSRGGLETGPNKAAQIPERCAIYRGRRSGVGRFEDADRLRQSACRSAPAPRRCGLCSQRQRAICLGAGPGAASGRGSADRHIDAGQRACRRGRIHRPAGNKPHIQIVDPATGTSRIISFNDLLNPAKALEITPKPGEIIFVPQSGLFRATYVVERLSPVITAAALIGWGCHEPTVRSIRRSGSSRRNGDLRPICSGARPLPVGGSEQAFFHLDMKRSLQLHWRLARALPSRLLLGVLYFLARRSVFKSWPRTGGERGVCSADAGEGSALTRAGAALAVRQQHV
jgi:hypothetical protein